MPELPNQATSFRGLIQHEGLEGHTWVGFPFVENPGSFGFDPQGRLYVAEANRFWLGVPDLRGANELIRDDFQAVTIEDRLKLYEKYATSFPEGWFSRVADRIIRLEDTDGNGAADQRTLFSDRFSEPLDGIGFSVLADDGSVYFTCIPSVWKLTDTNGDGVADQEEAIATGFGVRVSFIGHDLHGITRGPDGKLYFSVGDRSYNVTTEDGRNFNGEGKGAIFRCESDGSNFEVFCDGLRNPQELAFDNFGNLFTFDNTGDIGDLARMVYALEGTDSGWNMSHQSAAHYATKLDWGDFRPAESMWVKERMFDTYNAEQPQWVYPPASHVARGPSGVTYLTGESLPEDLRDRFLLANYRGPSEICTGLIIGVEPKGAGYKAISEEVLFEGVGASDVELGYDGSIYICDFGGGWSVNENGSIQVMQSKDANQREAGARVATLFKEGFSDRDGEELRELLGHTDRRVRQAAQFALVDQGEGGLAILSDVAANGSSLFPRLHATWGLGQAGRRGSSVTDDLISLLKDEESEVRASAARTLGDINAVEARNALINSLQSDLSLRVQSLAAIALSRVCTRGDEQAVATLFKSAVTNENTAGDIVLRHSILTGLYRLATAKQAIAKVPSPSSEERLLAVLALRQMESEQAVLFLGDSNPFIVREVIRAIYDTSIIDSAAGEQLAALSDNIGALPESIQRRIVAANYRRGSDTNAQALFKLANRDDLKGSVRTAALIALQQWEATIDTDPVLGHYRPIVNHADRTLESLSSLLGEDIRKFLAGSKETELITLALELANAIGVDLEVETLLVQVNNSELGADLRIAVLASLAQSGASEFTSVVQDLLTDADPAVQAAALSRAFELKLEGTDEMALTAIREGEILVARAAIDGIAVTQPDTISELWEKRETQLRPELWLDVYLSLSAKAAPAAAAYAAEKIENVFLLSLEGGDPDKGEVVFRNQGACLQCHKVGKDGGVQGPDLSAIAKRLPREKILESVAIPGAEIAEGYGMTTVMLKSGDAVVGRLSEETDDQVVVIGLDSKPVEISRSDIGSIAPPVSAMPPMAAALPPKDFRDLIAFLASRDGSKNGDDASHGEDEEIAK